MHGAGEHVVAGLAAIDVIVGVRTRQAPDHLVDVHVRGCAAAGLENVDGELIIIRALDHFLGGGFYRLGLFRR